MEALLTPENITFEESLSEGFYIISYDEGDNMIVGITKNSKYLFRYSTKDSKIKYSRENDINDENIDQNVASNQWRLLVHGDFDTVEAWKDRLFRKKDLNQSEIRAFFVKQSVNNALNVASNSQNSIEAGLSNLSYNPFTFNGINYASIEAFWQSLKFQEGSDDWQECTSLYGVKAKKYGDKVEKKERFTYNGNGYLIGSTEHQNLMKEALMEQLKQNPDKLKLLLDTGNTRLIHKPLKKDGTFYPDSTSIPGDIFSEILMELREKFKPNK